MSYDPKNPEHRKRNREYQRKWYNENKQKHISRVAENNKKVRSEIYLWLASVKSEIGCSLCGVDHPAALDFHHRGAAKKEFNISNAANRGWNKDRIAREIEKCDILCANCHRILHWEEKKS